LPKAGLNGFDWTFVQGSTFVLRLKFGAKIPAFGNTRNVYLHGMYHLSYFKENNPELVIKFMQEHAFAMVIAVDENHSPVATQVPLILKERDGVMYLQGHIKKKTDHHLALEQNNNVLVVFSGAHSYVSASLYEKQQVVSTWNYMSVHAKGELQFVDQAALLDMLKELTNHYEQNEDSPAAYKQLPQDYVKQLSKAIVGFEIKVTSLDHVFKLSQNRDEKSYTNIADHLNKGHADQKTIAAEMLKRKDQLFSK
jgi:transcriptional regulator